MTVAEENQSKDVTDVSIEGQHIHIRPIRADDLVRERDFVRQLSPTSRHFRFLGGVKELSDAVLKNLCEVDYDNRMAYIATINKDGNEQEIAVSRYAKDDEGNYECAVTVSDDWQHHGLGRILMNKLAEFARKRGIARLYSVDLADNRAMHALAKDMGMTVTQDPLDATLVRYELKL